MIREPDLLQGTSSYRWSLVSATWKADTQDPGSSGLALATEFILGSGGRVLLSSLCFMWVQGGLLDPALIVAKALPSDLPKLHLLLLRQGLSVSQGGLESLCKPGSLELVAPSASASGVLGSQAESLCLACPFC